MAKNLPKRLSIEEHIRVAGELEQACDLIFDACVIVQKAYGVSHRVSKRLEKLATSAGPLDLIRVALDDQFFADHPQSKNQDSPHVW